MSKQKRKLNVEQLETRRVLSVAGDFSGNGELDGPDIDALSVAVISLSNDKMFDVNRDGRVDNGDRRFWVDKLADTYFGDANFDGEFSSSDLVFVLQTGEYEDAVVGNSSWIDGDWSGDGEFDSADLVLVMQLGDYATGPRREAAALFDGTDDLIRVSDGAEAGLTDDMSIEMIIRADDFSMRRSLLGRGTTRNEAIVLETDGTLTFHQELEGGTTEVYSSVKTLSVDTWHHIAVTRQGSTITWFVDGEIANVIAASESHVASSQPVLLGAGFEGSFLGRIDEVALYDVALTSEAVSKHTMARDHGDYGRVVLSDEPFAYWRLNESKDSIQASDELRRFTGFYDGALSDTPGAIPPVLDGILVNGIELLNPAFSSYIQRYALHPNASPDSLTVRAIAKNGDDQILVNGTQVPSGAVTDIAGLTPGERVLISVANKERNTREYELVLLPEEFPVFETEILTDDVSQGQLYLTLGFGDGENVIVKADNYGVPEFFRRTDERVTDFKLHPNGLMSYAERTGRTNAETGRRISERVLLGPDFEEIGRFETIGLQHTDIHDFLITPEGNYVFIAYEPAMRDLAEQGGVGQVLVEDSVVQEVNPSTGEVVFEWNSWNNIPLSHDIAMRNEDYAHVNSVFLTDDNAFIVSARTASQILKIDRATGDIIWKLGGLANQFEFVNDPFLGICGQHTASILPNGNLLAFDNGQFCSVETSRGELTRIVEYRIDETTLTAELVWSYSQEGAYTQSQGSAQRLSNGNTLIGWGRGPAEMGTEVDSAGAKVFEIRATYDGETLRSYRVLRFTDVP